MKKLKYLNLCDNCLPISPEILGNPEDVDVILNYYHQLDSSSVRPLNEAKLLVVGQGSVGKTSLVNQFVDNRVDKNESQTDGLNRRNWSVNVNSKDVRLNVWDFGGQEIYHATHQFFLTKRSLYLLVCNCRTSEEENRLEYWLKLIQSFGGESPVIIVGNKKDEQPLDINRKALCTKYPNICDIRETSCQSGDGIEELRAAILREVAQLHDVYNLLPLSWFEVKEQLEAMDRDFISYPEYIGICYQHQIQEEQNQEQLIELLHNLGLVLNFREHPLLKDTNVLNPGWVTAGIYQLLSDETLKTETKGILTDADLSRILDAERYPADRHHYLTDLMQEFQLCFELPDCPSPKFLIPGLLPKDEPKQTDLEGNTLEFQYHYGILPEGVMSRFIVLSHEDIHNEVYWRSGVMLADREGEGTPNIARIKADSEDNKIFIAISGREQTRRSMLSQIRKTFTRIHRSFANLNVTEWVPVPDHPEHPPLDYQELLGLEAMNEETVTIGKLRLRLNLRKLLDGYESMEARRQQQAKDFAMEEAVMQPNVFNIERADFQMPQHNTDARSSTTHQHGEGDNFAGDQVQGDKFAEP
ncbi:MAG: COR domain-containing protein [Leptolyngbyaceae cyanobacterium]